MRYLNKLRLQPGPFEAVKSGRKTIEMRLFVDDKARISIGELIEFTNTETGEQLLCFVDEIKLYDSFEDLYAHYDKRDLGYNDEEEANPKDMLRYYPIEKQKDNLVMAIRIHLLSEKDHLFRRYKIDRLFSENDIKLAIFDLDGTLIDSTSLWADIDTMFFKNRGMEVPPNYGKEIAHIGLAAAAKLTREKYCPKEKEEDIIKEWNDLALDAYMHHIPMKKYALDVLDALKKKDIKIAIATANSEELYLPCLKRLGLLEYFSVVMDVNSCKEGKDSPEIFDKITDIFKVKRNQTVIFEDMITAQKTGYEAGYLVIGINDKNSVKDHRENRKYCHVFIENFYDVISAIYSE